jgi:hypothetical protein
VVLEHGSLALNDPEGFIQAPYVHAEHGITTDELLVNTKFLLNEIPQADRDVYTKSECDTYFSQGGNGNTSEWNKTLGVQQAEMTKNDIQRSEI